MCLSLQILEGVSQCHQAGVLHGDIKDENVMIEPSTGAVALIDFGSSLLLHTGDYTEFYGTREYSPPEWLTDRRYYEHQIFLSSNSRKLQVY